MGEASKKLGFKEGFFSHFGEICTYSWRSLLAHPWVLAFLFAFNVGFIFLFSFYQQPLGLKINYTLDLLSNSFQTIVHSVDVGGFVGAVQNSTLTDVLFNDVLLRELVNDLVLLLLLLALVAYVVYTFFQSTSVKTIGWMVLDRKPYTLWAFIRLNTLWFVLYILFRLVILIIDIFVNFVSNGNTAVPDLSILYTLVHVILFYFVFISYTFAADKFAWSAIRKSFRVGLGKFSTMKYYLLNYIPFGLYLVPFTKLAIIVPLFNLLMPLGDIGMGLQLIILFAIYVLFIANVFTITHEVSSSYVHVEGGDGIR